MKIKTFIIATSSCILLSNICVAGIVDSGNCSGQVSWDKTNGRWQYSDSSCTYTIDDQNVLRISGTEIGTKNGYSAPWWPWKTSISEVVISDTITSIGARAFLGFTATENIKIPNSVTTIGSDAFSQSTLSSIEIPSSVTSIGNAFRFMPNLKSITIPNSVTSISGSAFLGDSALESVILPNNQEFTSISGGLFRDCTNLKEITIPNSVTTIGNGAFENATSLTNLTIPDSVTSIGPEAFKGTQNLTSLVLPDSLFAEGSAGLTYALQGSNIKTIYCKEGNEACLNYNFKTCDMLGPDNLCYGQEENYALENIVTYKVDSGGKIIVGNKKYASVADLQKGLEFAPKRIYTVEEAERVSKKTGNTFKLRYK